MSGDENIVETIKEEVTEAAKAVVAEGKSIAHEVADAIAEGKPTLPLIHALQHGDARQRVRALAYVADRGHSQYAGRLSLDEQLRLVRQGHGNYGPNDESVMAPVTAPEARGIRDTPLHRLAAMLRGEGALHRPA